MFEIVDGRTPEHGYTISSPCEPNGSGELITNIYLCHYGGINKLTKDIRYHNLTS